MDFIHVTVAAIIKRNDQYLLVKERASSGDIVFNQPAGHVELKESLVEAVIREVYEETGLDYTPTSLVGTYLLSPATNGKTYLRFCFNGEVPDQQQPNPNDPEILDNCWLTLDEIIKLPRKELRSALVLRCIDDHIKGKKQPVESLDFYSDEHLLADDCIKSLNN
jgi:phosphatase NudJ